MKRIVVALLISSCALTGAATVRGQRAAVPSCDADNGGLKLPAGFCALVIADHLGEARNLVVAPNGDIFVSLRTGPRAEGQPPQAGYILGLRDTNGDGKIDMQEKFGTSGATGIRLHNGYLYYSTPSSIERFKLNPGQLKPAGPAEVIVSGFPSGPNQAGHRDKDIAFDEAGNVYVNVGLPSNACTNPDRRPDVMGQDPCPQLEEHGGIWRFKADVPGQVFSSRNRYATGLRQAVALDWYNGHLYVAMNSRDSLNDLFPGKFTAHENATRPLEPLLEVHEGSVFGWPYCFWDGETNNYVLAPEYGGDGKQVGRCAQFEKPVAAFPAHYAPVDLLFYTGSMFPAHYRGGAFVTSHGSWNRAPEPMAGYQIMFQPFANGKPSGNYEVFADGFKGREPLMNPADAAARPDGTAQGPDGSLYITESINGKTWRVIYKGAAK
jgi:glucose/arabinose dehydrogenase